MGKKHQHGTLYLVCRLSCGCDASCTMPQISAGQAACLSEPTFPPRRPGAIGDPNTQAIVWANLRGTHSRPHRCCDGPAPPPPSSTLPELPNVLETVRDAQGNPLKERDEVVVLGTGGQVRYIVQGFENGLILATNGRRILPASVVRADRYVPLAFGSAS